jgi:hypothetical protein
MGSTSVVSLISTLRPTLVNEFRYSNTFWSNHNTPPTADQCPGCLWTAISDSMGVLMCGVAVGLPLAVAAIRPLTDILPDGVDPWNIGMFAAVTLVLVCVGAGAAWIPAREAANVDPSLALRQE